MMFMDERMPRGQDDQERRTDNQKARLDELRRQKTLESYEYLLSDPRGRRFLMRLGQRYYMADTTFEANSKTFYKEGQRSVALDLFDDIRKISQKAEESLIQAELEYRRECRTLEQRAKEESGNE